MFASLNAKALGLNLTASQTVELAARHGFGGVDLLVRDLVERDENVDRIRARIEELQLRPGAWPLPMDWRNDKTTFEHDLRQLPTYARIAQRLGLSATCTWVEPASFDHVEAIDKHRTRIAAIARILHDFAIRLGLEVIGVESFRAEKGKPLYHHLGNARFLELYHELSERSPNIGLTLDAFHLHAANEDNSTWTGFGVANVVWVHVADLPLGAKRARDEIHDTDRGLPGEHGDVDNQGMLSRLMELDYDGPVTAEPMPACRSLAGLSVEEIAGRTRKALARVWPQ